LRATQGRLDRHRDGPAADGGNRDQVLDAATALFDGILVRRGKTGFLRLKKHIDILAIGLMKDGSIGGCS